MVRIALREVAEAAPLDETIIELSQLADICLTKVYEHWDNELRQRWGSPASQFAIIGVGKLGGRELNHSSDVDLIFVYSDEGQLTAQFSYHEWFTRLGNKIIETFAASDPAGSLFRVDLRLRPEGSAGPLVRSLESMENYYAGLWRNLGAAGPDQGALDLRRSRAGLRFSAPVTAIYFSEEPDAGFARRCRFDQGPDRARHCRSRGARAERKAGRGRDPGNRVRGPGAPVAACGPAPFFAGAGARLRTIRGLAELELLPNEDANRLETAYRFLRRVEHRLQIEAEQQTHTVPEEGEALEVLAQSLGFAEGQPCWRNCTADGRGSARSSSGS